MTDVIEPAAETSSSAVVSDDGKEEPPATPRAIPSEERPATSPPAAPAPRRRGGFFPALLGGALAAGAGFGVAQVVPQGWPIAGIPADLAASVTAQKDETARLSAALAALPAPVTPDFGPVEARLSELAARLDAVEKQAAATGAAVAALPPPVELPADPTAALAALDDRIAAVEAQPPGTFINGDPAAITALQGEVAALKAAVAAPSGRAAGADPAALAALQSEIDSLKAAVEAPSGPVQAALAEVTAATDTAKAALADATAQAAALKADAEAAALMGRQQAALGSIRAALESGVPFMTAVEALQSGGITVDPMLVADAAKGLPTLAEVQDAFPAAARRALEDSLRADMGDSTVDRLASFLRTQVGARSLEPREGSDPDAVLSRAEAALDEGRLTDALAELAALPEVGKAALAEWQVTAQKRIDAEAAVGALAAALGQG